MSIKGKKDSWSIVDDCVQNSRARCFIWKPKLLKTLGRQEKNY
jgi:hypothetical protein